MLAGYGACGLTARAASRMEVWIAINRPVRTSRSPMNSRVFEGPCRFRIPLVRALPGHGVIIPTNAECGFRFQTYRHWDELKRRVASSPSVVRGVNGASMGITCALRSIETSAS